MRYLTLAAEYTGSCIKEDMKGQIDYKELQLDEMFCKELDEWNSKYKSIIPLEAKERKQKSNEIELLDKKGIYFSKKLTSLIEGGAKVKYYSEGLLKYVDLNIE